MIGKAGSRTSLPFLFLVTLTALVVCSTPAQTNHEAVPRFQEFQSSCIDLGNYDADKRQLTVRFVNRKAERFYRYSNVEPEIWTKLQALNERGGIGSYLHETILADAKKHPHEEVTIRRFETVRQKKRAENSK